MNENRSDNNPEKDFREGEKNLGPHGNMRPDRFPESAQTKDQRKDSERSGKDDSNIEDLAADVSPTGSRVTSSDPSDIAGVSDLDRGMKRSRRNKL